MSKFVLAIGDVAIEYLSHDIKDTSLQPGNAEICLLSNSLCPFIQAQGHKKSGANPGFLKSII